MKFYELAVGARFVFRGQRSEKTAMSMASDEQGCGHVFMGDVEVAADGEARLLSPPDAARWKPGGRHWTDYLTPAPGQRALLKS